MEAEEGAEDEDERGEAAEFVDEDMLEVEWDGRRSSERESSCLSGEGQYALRGAMPSPNSPSLIPKSLR